MVWEMDIVEYGVNVIMYFLYGGINHSFGYFFNIIFPICKREKKRGLAYENIMY